MALFDQNHLYSTPIQRAITSFNAFILDGEDAIYEGSSDTAPFGEYGGEGRCLLDYVYVWLGQGSGAFVCPTYESYLLGVIGIIDDSIRREEKESEIKGFSAKRAFDTPFLRIFHWTKRQRAAMRRGEIADRRTPWGHSHPALDRETYNYHRETAVQELLEERLKGVSESLKASSEKK
ncbi:hypothetical protein [Arthrobacter sp. KNU40]|uniref:hypothetical protein n=1 Tax=Arthrobacter sp. KNU40 TaxID=3447965 RepID=UPI003F63FBB6